MRPGTAVWTHPSPKATSSRSELLDDEQVDISQGVGLTIVLLCLETTRPGSVTQCGYSGVLLSPKSLAFVYLVFLRACPAWAVAPRGFAPSTVVKSIIIAIRSKSHNSHESQRPGGPFTLCGQSLRSRMARLTWLWRVHFCFCPFPYVDTGTSTSPPPGNCVLGHHDSPPSTSCYGFWLWLGRYHWFSLNGGIGYHEI